MADINFKGTVDALFQGMNGIVSSKTVVGDAIHIGDTIILPLIDVSFGVGAGAFNGDKKEKGAGGLGGKMTPCAVLGKDEKMTEQDVADILDGESKEV